MTEDEQIRRILAYEVQRLGYKRISLTNLYSKGLKSIRIMFIRATPVLKFEYMGLHMRLEFNKLHKIPRNVVLEGKSREFISRLHEEFNKAIENIK